MSFLSAKQHVISPESALPGREQTMPVASRHYVLDARLAPPFPDTTELAVFGLGCFWGAEKIFWEASGVYSTSVGYAGGFTPNPTYEEVCSGRTGHTEAVQVVFWRERTSYQELLRVFWEAHDPTQGMRQGNDMGTQYRSAIYTFGEGQLEAARASEAIFEESLRAAGYGEITTEIRSATEYFFAEDYHQQYLAKNPMGYCGLGGTGVSCPVSVEV